MPPQTLDRPRAARAESPRGPALTPHQSDLAERYIPLARSMARPYKIAWPNHRDDFESASMLALVESARRFDPDRACKFSTYAQHRIWGALRDFQRSLVALGYRCDPKAAPLLTGLPKDPERKGRMLGADAMPPTGSGFDSEDTVRAILGRLRGRHKVACKYVYIDGMSQKAAARRMGLSQSRLSFLMREAIDLLRQSVESRAIA